MEQKSEREYIETEDFQCSRYSYYSVEYNGIRCNNDVHSILRLKSARAHIKLLLSAACIPLEPSHHFLDTPLSAGHSGLLQELYPSEL